MLRNFLLGCFGAPRPCAGDWWESVIEGDCNNGRPSVRPYSFPLQPVNTYSNLAYAVAGVVSALVLNTPAGWVFAAAMTFLCVGSGLYHGWPARGTAALDHAGMYAVFITLVFHGVGFDLWWALAIFAGLGAWLYRYAFRVDLNVMMGTFLSVVLASKANTQAVIALALFALAYGVWHLDRKRVLVGRWGHGIWHVLTAAAIALMFTA